MSKEKKKVLPGSRNRKFMAKESTTSYGLGAREKISGKKGGALYAVTHEPGKPAVPFADFVISPDFKLTNNFQMDKRKSINKLTPLEKMGIAKSGVSKKDLENLKINAGLDYDDLAKALSVARATLINKKGAEKFNSQVSERIVGIADIYSYGYEVFSNESDFNKWMFAANKALAGEVPYNLLDSQYGREEIKNLIGRIEYGVYS